MGIKYHGYQTDISRNKVVGEPEPLLRRILDCCLEQHLSAIQAIGPDVPTFKPQKIMLGVTEKWGFVEYDNTTVSFGRSYGPTSWRSRTSTRGTRSPRRSAWRST